MKSAICNRFGIDIQLFAFSHCRDVVAAITNAGGFEVPGTVGHDFKVAASTRGLWRQLGFALLVPGHEG